MHPMRYLLLAIIFMAFAGCKKQGASNEDGENGSLIGNWELYRTFGGMMPTTTYNPGNGNLLRFDSTTYQMIRGGQIVLQGTYQLKTDSLTDVNSCALLPPRSSAPNWIVADSSTGLRTFYEINGNTLTTTSGCIPADGGGSIYKRKAGEK